MPRPASRPPVLYQSLGPDRIAAIDLIADSVEYMVEAHRADALVCISNCDKITPGMLMAALRCNIPTVFVSGGPMEGGHTTLADGARKTGMHLIDTMTTAADTSVSDDDLTRIEEAACPTCGSCAGMFTANSMNCLVEVLGLGSLDLVHPGLPLHRRGSV